MRKLIFLGAVSFLILLLALIFQTFAEQQITFTDAKQNPKRTIEKYRDIWKDERILTKKEPLKEYQYGEVIASITIPTLQLYELNVYYGSDPINNNWQITSPGHIGNWGNIGEKYPSAIGAHNYQLFKNLPDLKIGDRFIVENEADIYVFEVVSTFIYRAGQQEWEEMYHDLEPYSLVLMTCYPLNVMESPDRYIVNTRMVRGTKLVNT